MELSPELIAALGQAGKGRVGAPRLKNGALSLVLDVAGLSTAEREVLDAAVRGAARRMGHAEVRIVQTAERASEDDSPAIAALPPLIAVGSGKGGVGKSTLSANLAVALRRLGLRAGLVDADIYGPSQPRLLGTGDARPEARDKRLVPVESRWGVPALSMGHLAKPGQAIAWRGPMAGNALGQLIDAHWDAAGVEVLVVDLPPGTGDVQLSMISKHKPTGALIVSTPQDLALIDAARAVDLFAKADVPLIGMVENMAGYVCPHCGEISDPFGAGGAERAAAEMGLPFLGRVPLDLAIRKASDAGEPPAAGGGPEASAFLDIAGQVAEWLRSRR